MTTITPEILDALFDFFSTKEDLESMSIQETHTPTAIAIFTSDLGKKEEALKNLLGEEFFNSLVQKIGEFVKKVRTTNTGKNLVQSTSSNPELEECRKFIERLEAEIKSNSKTPPPIINSSTSPNSAHIPQKRTLLVIGYFSFALVLLSTVYVIYWFFNSCAPEIKIDINVAQLVGGSLVGIGAALAGGAYAIKTLGLKGKNPE